MITRRVDISGAGEEHLRSLARVEAGRTDADALAQQQRRIGSTAPDARE